MADVRDDDGVIAALPDLQIEVSHHEDMLILQQTDHSGEVDRIAIHRWQVRLLAEQMDLLPAAPALPRRDVAVILARRLRTLHERADDLGKYLNEFIDDDFAKTFSLATCEIGDEFLADLDELLGRPVPKPSIPVPAATTTPAAAGRQGKLV